MARTIAEIQQEMITAKEADANLSGITSTSQTAIWRLIFFICAAAIKFIEDLFDVHKEDIEDRRVELPTGTLLWYASESLVYQFGDDLQFVSTYVDEDGETVTLRQKQLTYNPVDTNNRIVDLAAATIVNGIIIIKAAKLVSGVAEKLSAAEKTGFTGYWTEKRFAGDSISIISQDPDLLKCEYTITYDSQILASDGESLANPGTFPVEDSIDEFLQSFQSTNENFNGDMQVMKLTTAIESTAGVLNAVATNIEGKPDGGTYSDILAITTQIYNATAGYMKIDPGFPLSTTLTYIAG